MRLVALVAALAAGVLVAAAPHPGVPGAVLPLPPYCGNQPHDGHGWGVAPPPAAREGETLTLAQVQTIIRHGDRTSWIGSQCWANDTAVWKCNLDYLSIPGLDRSKGRVQVPRLFRKVYLDGDEVYPGNCAVGQLTQRGFYQEVLNGRDLRAAYVDTGLLSPKFNAREIFLRSDDEPRTVQSAQSVILGMFPASEFEGDDEDDYGAAEAPEAEVIDIHTMDLNLDDMEPKASVCAKWGSYQTGLVNSSAYQHHIETITKPLLKSIAQAMGVAELTDAVSLHDCFNVHVCHKYPLPGTVTQEMYDALMTEVTWQTYQEYMYPDPEANARAGIGFLIADMVKQLEARVRGSDEAYKFLLLSGHDTTIMPFLRAFGGDDGLWSPYASMVSVELYSRTAKALPYEDSYAVRFVYNGKVVKLPFCGGSELCEYSTFLGHARALMPSGNGADCTQ